MKLEWRDIVLVDGLPPISTSLTANETAELQRLAAGKNVLEVGSAYGYSAVAMALGGALKVTAVDPHNWLNSYGVMTANLLAYGVVGKVEIITGDSRAVLPRLAVAGPWFDTIFVDGDHSAEVVAFDIEWAVKLLKPGGALALHDLDEVTCPGVRVAVDQFRQPDYVIDTLAVYVGLASS